MTEQFALVIAIAIGIVCYLLIILATPKSMLNKSTQHLRQAMQRLEEQHEQMKLARPAQYLPEQRKIEDNLLVRAYMSIPGASLTLGKIEQAGLLEQLDKVIMFGLAMWLGMSALLRDLGVAGAMLSLMTVWVLMQFYVSRRARKRRDVFLAMFPDALDIIVRSVRAGYPVNSAIAMVADSLPPEVGAEYLRITREASYGFSLSEAFDRFAERINEPDVSFLALVVRLQQETGGNLAEIIESLSTTIRQRQQLRMKIRALSSEGRITVWILVGIAIFMVLAVQFSSPGHFDRLFNTSTGHNIMIGVGTSFIMAFVVIRKIINFKI